jgi:PAS domain S-box-containing protein
LDRGIIMSEKPTYEELEKRVLELEDYELELQKTEMLLKDEINWRRLLIEESRDAIVVLDQNAKVYEANNRFADMLGYSRAEVYQLHAWDWDAHLKKEQILELAKTVNDVGHHFEAQHRRKDGRLIDVELSNNGAVYRGKKLIFCICRDISNRKKAEKEREELIKRLRDSLAEIKTLRGILPFCSFCKKIRDDKGYWEQVDIYINKHFEADISHSICPECFKKHYPNEYKEIYPE